MKPKTKAGLAAVPQIHFRAHRFQKLSDQETQGAPESSQAAPEFCWWMTTGRGARSLGLPLWSRELLVVAEAADGLEALQKVGETLARSRLDGCESRRWTGGATASHLQRIRIPRS